MKTPQDIDKIALVRLQEAEVLYNNSFYDGSFYLAGYSIELALKAKICHLLDIPNLYDEGNQVRPKELLKPFKTHDLDSLILLAGRKNRLETAKSKDVNLYKNWSLISEKWNEQCRYLCCGTKSKQETENLITAIKDPKSGVLSWILNN